MEKHFYVYILASGYNGTLYVGVTSNLPRRIWQHKHNEIEGFTRRYKVHDLVYYEHHGNARSAATREQQIKQWQRKWKIELIEKDNPGWLDVYGRITGEGPVAS